MFNIWILHLRQGKNQTTVATKGQTSHCKSHHCPTTVTTIFCAVREPQLFRGTNPYASLTLLMATLGSVRAPPYQIPTA